MCILTHQPARGYQLSLAQESIESSLHRPDLEPLKQHEEVDASAVIHLGRDLSRFGQVASRPNNTVSFVPDATASTNVFFFWAEVSIVPRKRYSRLNRSNEAIP